MTKKIAVDCSAGTAQTVDMTAIEQAAYDARQPAGLAEARAISALVALQGRHQDALTGIRDGLTASEQGTTGDLAAVRALAASLQAGTPPTQAQLLQLLRFVLRVLALQGRV